MPERSQEGYSLDFRKLAEAREQLTEQLSKVIVGQQQVIEELLISLFSRGHCLLEGVPGLAKTLMISTIARALELTFSRIQLYTVTRVYRKLKVMRERQEQRRRLF